MLVKNIGGSWFGKQQSVINYATIFVIHVLDVIVLKRLISSQQEDKGLRFHNQF